MIDNKNKIKMVYGADTEFFDIDENIFLFSHGNVMYDMKFNRLAEKADMEHFKVNVLTNLICIKSIYSMESAPRSGLIGHCSEFVVYNKDLDRVVYKPVKRTYSDETREKDVWLLKDGKLIKAAVLIEQENAEGTVYKAHKLVVSEDETYEIRIKGCNRLGGGLDRLFAYYSDSPYDIVLTGEVDDTGCFVLDNGVRMVYNTNSIAVVYSTDCTVQVNDEKFKCSTFEKKNIMLRNRDGARTKRLTVQTANRFLRLERMLIRHERFKGNVTQSGDRVIIKYFDKVLAEVVEGNNKVKETEINQIEISKDKVYFEISKCVM